jgi:pimeloyl-ACP methyl ester carboxylesterase
VLVPLGQALADRFTVFAFDTPGFGWSDPLRMSRPDAADFGAALIATFDALGIASAPVYGSHTGAAIAVAAAIGHPARIPALVLDGYALFTPAEQAEATANYLMPIRPEWDGSHLAALWSRVKDQFTFFPWYLRSDAGRLPRGLVPLDVLQDVIVDFLAAGDNYRPAYAAAFRYAATEGLRDLTVPTTIVARTDDLLFGHLDRLPDVPPAVTLRPLGEDRAVWAAVIAETFQQAARGEAPAIPDNAAETIMRIPGGTLGLTRLGHGDGKPVVLLAAIPGSAAGSAGLARAIAAARPVICFDLPGIGASTLGQIDLPGIVQALRIGLDQMGITNADILACEESAAIGCALAQTMSSARLVLLNPVADTSRVAVADSMVDVPPGTSCATGRWGGRGSSVTRRMPCPPGPIRTCRACRRSSPTGCAAARTAVRC